MVAYRLPREATCELGRIDCFSASCEIQCLRHSADDILGADSHLLQLAKVHVPVALGEASAVTGDQKRDVPVVGWIKSKQAREVNLSCR